MKKEKSKSTESVKQVADTAGGSVADGLASGPPPGQTPSTGTDVDSQPSGQDQRLPPVDDARQEWDRLAKLHDVETPARTDAPASPAPDPSAVPEPDAPSVTSSGGTGVPDEWDGQIDARSFTALKRAHLVPNVDDWKGFDFEQKAELVSAAKKLLSDRERKYQQGQTNTVPQAGQFAVNQPPASWQTQEPTGPVFGHDPAGQPVKNGTDITLPDEVETELKKIADDYGDDLAQRQRNLEMIRYRQIRRQQVADHQQQQSILEWQAQQQRVQQDAQMRSVEDAAMSELASEFPQLTDPAQRELIREKARTTAAVRYQLAQRGLARPLDGAKPLFDEVVRGEYFQQALSREADRQRQETARVSGGTFDRGKSTASRTAVVPSDMNRRIWDELERLNEDGVTGEMARSQVQARLRNAG